MEPARGGRREIRELDAGASEQDADRLDGGKVSEFDKLKDDAEHDAQQHPQQVKEGEEQVEKKLGVQQPGSGQPDQAGQAANGGNTGQDSGSSGQQGQGQQ